MDIFVAKLSSETTADHISELFSQFGTVDSCKVIMDRETGNSKCYGFVEMNDEAEASAAIEQLNDTNFMGNYIIVKKSEPRTQERRSFDRRPGGNRARIGGGGRRPDGNRQFNRSDREGGGDRRNFNRDRNFNRYD